MAHNSERKSNAKDILKQAVPCWIISFALCFMLFFYEPIMMYVTNKDNFWFDFGIVIKPVLMIFLIFFAGTAAILTGLYFICRKFSENVKPYRIILTVIFVCFIVLYIQGNILASHLPALDGSAIDWGAYTSDNIITAIICVILTVAAVFCCIKLGLERFVSWAAGISAAIFAILTVTLVTTCIQKNAFESKNNLISTTQDFNKASTHKNFYIFMVDSQSATEFTNVISTQEQFRHAFDDFTYYTDTLSTYAYTRDSVPYVLSGHLNKNDENFGDYSENALNNSTLFNALEERDYDMYLYDEDLAWYGKKNFDIKNNPGTRNVSLRFGEYFKQEMRYVWFKYLPYGLKKASEIEKLNFGNTIDKFKWGNDVLYNEFSNGSGIEKTSGAQFRFIHAEGAHVPFDMDENMNRIKGGTYIQKTTATAKLIASFIENLKANGVYDNSVIIIMADHGYQPKNAPENYILSRFNPILLIKGVNEKHDLIYSEKPVSYLDLPQAYEELLDGKQSTDLFSDVEYPRTRKVIWYEIYKEEHMVEYETVGKATEWDKFHKTGAIFDLSKK